MGNPSRSQVQAAASVAELCLVTRRRSTGHLRHLGFDYPMWTGMWLIDVGRMGLRGLSAGRAPSGPTHRCIRTKASSTPPRGLRWREHCLHAARRSFWSRLPREQPQTTDTTDDGTGRPGGAIESFNGVKEVAWSPDGRWLALGPPATARVPIVVWPPSTCGPERVTRSADGAGSVSWSPDGRWLDGKNVSEDWGRNTRIDFYGADPPPESLST
jgi:hypothetical protein